MRSLVRPELPTASVVHCVAMRRTPAAVDNSAPSATHPQSTYKSGKAVQTSGATSITSRPMLLAAVGRMTRHSRVTKLVLAVTHEAAAQIKVLIANVRAGLSHILSAAPQLYKAQRWPTMLRYIVGQMLACQGPRGAPPASVPTG